MEGITFSLVSSTTNYPIEIFRVAALKYYPLASNNVSGFLKVISRDCNFLITRLNYLWLVVEFNWEIHQ
jgi:hypothetical protein